MTSTTSASHQLVQNISATAPMMRMSPRNVIDRDEPIASRMVVTSPVRREVNSPTRWVS